MDYLLQSELETWLSKVDLPVAADVGANVGYVHDIQNQAIYGCKNYDGSCNPRTCILWIHG